MYCRITYKRKRKTFSTGHFIKPNNWNSSKQVAYPPNDEHTFINSQLSLIRNEINQAFLFLQLLNRDFNVEQVYKQYAGETQNEDKTLMDAFNYHNNRMKKLVDIETTHTSWEKYNQTQKHVKDFLWSKFKKRDILLKELKPSFINEYEFFLKTEKKFMAGTVYKSVQRFRKVIKMSIAMDYLQKDPFMLYKAKEPKPEIIFLSESELKALEKHKFSSQRLQEVCDMFIFCCYTGLAYQEMSNLTPDNIIKHSDNSLWIEMNRQKTHKKFVVPLMSKAQRIINLYKTEDRLLPVISNQKFNAYLKEIAEIVGIKKRITHHTARKTFATTILLNNDVPLEIVSELLGHSNISMTKEHYAVVLKSKLKEHIEKVSKKIP